MSQLLQLIYDESVFGLILGLFTHTRLQPSSLDRHLSFCRNFIASVVPGSPVVTG